MGGKHEGFEVTIRMEWDSWRREEAMENSSLLGFTSGRDEVYHVEIPCQSKGARETLSDTPHFYFVEDCVDPFSGLDNKPMWNPCCQEAKIPEHFVSLDSFKQKGRDPVHTENTEGSGLEVGISRNDGESWVKFKLNNQTAPAT